MNIKTAVYGIVAALFLISCDDNTSSLGANLIPSEDLVNVNSDTYYATSRSIAAGDSLLARTSTSFLGRFTDPETGVSIEAGYVTQVNCVEDFEFPDSVYGLEQFHFSKEFDRKMEGVYKWKADLRLYFTRFFGDSTSCFTVEVYPLNKVIDPYKHYYADFDPKELYDASQEPLATVTVSPTDFNVSDSLRDTKTYYPNIYIKLPDTVAENILRKYYSEGGKKYFSSAPQFIENVCKGFYIRCVQGDGTIMYIDKTDLEINFKYAAKSATGKADSLASAVSDFCGSSEVMQINSISNTGLDALINDNTGTWIKTPFGVLTEVTLPIDEMTEDQSTINSAKISFYKKNSETVPYYRFSTPSVILMLRKQQLAQFFEGNSNTDNIESFAASFNGTYNQYSFTNIARLIMTCRDERDEWLKAHSMQADAAGKAAYAAARPDWNKVVLVPATPQADANKTVLGYSLDMNMGSVRLQGGPGSQIAIKAIRTSF